MPEQQCPNCGGALPSELGQHSVAPITGLVTCPHCGADVELREPGAGEQDRGAFQDADAAPPGRTEGRETFSGQEELDDLRDEVQEKPS